LVIIPVNGEATPGTSDLKKQPAFPRRTLPGGSIVVAESTGIPEGVTAASSFFTLPQKGIILIRKTAGILSFIPAGSHWFCYRIPKSVLHFVLSGGERALCHDPRRYR
jgi:hypothetical protein